MEPSHRRRCFRRWPCPDHAPGVLSVHMRINEIYSYTCIHMRISEIYYARIMHLAYCPCILMRISEIYSYMYRYRYRYTHEYVYVHVYVCMCTCIVHLRSRHVVSVHEHEHEHAWASGDRATEQGRIFQPFSAEIHVSPGTRTTGPTRLVTDLNLYTPSPKHTKHTPEPECRGPMPRDIGVAYPKRFRVNMPSHMGVNMPRSIGVSYPSGC